MGLMDKVKQGVKDFDEKAGNAIDVSKLESKVRDEERAIDGLYADIGKAVVERLDSGKAVDESTYKPYYDKIKEALKKIDELKGEVDSLKEKK